MTTTVLGRVSQTADQVRTEARQLDPAKVALTLLMVVPFLLGGLVGLIGRLVWTVFAWAWTAAVVGFRAAYRTPDAASGESDTP